jgi:hypothetical protein
MRRGPKNIDWDAVAFTHGFSNAKNMFTQWYLTEYFSIPRIAALVNKSKTAVRLQLLSLNVKLRGKGGSHSSDHFLTMPDLELIADFGIGEAARRMNISYQTLNGRIQALRRKDLTVRRRKKRNE